MRQTSVRKVVLRMVKKNSFRITVEKIFLKFLCWKSEKNLQVASLFLAS